MLNLILDNAGLIALVVVITMVGGKPTKVFVGKLVTKLGNLLLKVGTLLNPTV